MRDLRLLANRQTRHDAGGSPPLTAVDFSKSMLSRAVAQHRVCADMLHLPFAARSFDTVISGFAIGHAPDADERAVDTAWRAPIAFDPIAENMSGTPVWTASSLRKGSTFESNLDTQRRIQSECLTPRFWFKTWLHRSVRRCRD